MVDGAQPFSAMQDTKTGRTCEGPFCTRTLAVSRPRGRKPRTDRRFCRRLCRSQHHRLKTLVETDPEAAKNYRPRFKLTDTQRKELRSMRYQRDVAEGKIPLVRLGNLDDDERRDRNRTAYRPKRQRRIDRLNAAADNVKRAHFDIEYAEDWEIAHWLRERRIEPVSPGAQRWGTPTIRQLRRMIVRTGWQPDEQFAEDIDGYLWRVCSEKIVHAVGGEDAARRLYSTGIDGIDVETQERIRQIIIDNQPRSDYQRGSTPSGWVADAIFCAAVRQSAGSTETLDQWIEWKSPRTGGVRSRFDRGRRRQPVIVD